MKKAAKKLETAAVVEYVRCPQTGLMVIRGTNGAEGIVCRRIWAN